MEKWRISYLIQYIVILKIQDQLGDYLMKSLENMLGQLLDVPICGVENFMSDMFGQINNILDTGLGDI